MAQDDLRTKLETKENVNLAGLGVFLPFVEKLLLYQTFFKKNSLWTKNKNEYWRHEKFILMWAWSKGHQHLGRVLDTNRLLQIYGIRIVDEDWRVAELPQVESKDSDSLVREMLETRGSRLEPIMGNLEIKGLTQRYISYGDIADSLIKTTEKELADSGNRIVKAGLNEVAHSIAINRRGLLVGELVFEEENGGLWKYKLAISILKILGIVLVLSASLLALNALFNINLSLPINETIRPIHYLSLAVILFLFIYSIE